MTFFLLTSDSYSDPFQVSQILDSIFDITGNV